jgi:hypothetical protein
MTLLRVVLGTPYFQLGPNGRTASFKFDERVDYRARRFLKHVRETQSVWIQLSVSETRSHCKSKNQITHSDTGSWIDPEGNFGHAVPTTAIRLAAILRIDHIQVESHCVTHA